MTEKFYVLSRNEERDIVCVEDGFDPLYGRGSWDIFAGPFDTREIAENTAYTDNLVSWSALARLGGQSKSDRKAAAARENGRKGGRPRKA